MEIGVNCRGMMRVRLSCMEGIDTMRKRMDPANPLFTCIEESNETIVKSIQERLGNNTAAIALLMTYKPKKITPSRVSDNDIYLAEELGIEQAIASIKERRKSRNEKIENLFLLINTFGGEVSSSYKIASAIRENFKNITVFIPYYV
jgi:ClpP class serine protease